MGSTTNLFTWLVHYHINFNLEECKEHIKEGSFLNPTKTRKKAKGVALNEGTDENQLTRGVLLIAYCGESEKSAFRSQAVIHTDPQLSFAHSASALHDIFESADNEDGAFIFDIDTGMVQRVPLIANSPSQKDNAVHTNIHAYVPADFIDRNGNLNILNNIGTKTRLAIALPVLYNNVETFQIKRTAYGKVGLGKVTHFTSEGLYEEFFFEYDPTQPERMHLGAQGIIGKYRRFVKGECSPKVCLEALWEPSEENTKRILYS